VTAVVSILPLFGSISAPLILSLAGVPTL